MPTATVKILSWFDRSLVIAALIMGLIASLLLYAAYSKSGKAEAEAAATRAQLMSLFDEQYTPEDAIRDREALGSIVDGLNEQLDNLATRVRTLESQIVTQTSTQSTSSSTESSTQITVPEAAEEDSEQ